MVNIFDLKPHEVSSDITGYVIGIYSKPGAGKTTLASQAEKCLILATEIGYKAIPGVMAQPINSWSDFLIAVSQLRKPEAKQMFKTVAIDTLDELVFLATEYVLQQNGVSDLSEIPYGKGYNQLEDVLRKPFRQIVESYGLILLAHDTSKQDEDDDKLKYATLNFNKKVKRVVVGLLDLLVYVEMKRGAEERIMHFQPSELWEAKTRFKNIVPSAVFSYDNLVKAVADAVDGIATKESRESFQAAGSQLPTQEDFEEFLKEVNDTAMGIIEKTNKVEEVQSIISKHLNGRKLGQAKLDDYYLLKNIMQELKGL